MINNKIKKIFVGLSVFIIYLTLTILYTGFYKHNVFSFMFSPSGDQSYFLFFLKWWPWAITHNVNPFKTNYLTYPRFYNTAWLTSVPILSLIASPLTYYFGVVFSWNILILLAPVTAAFSAYLLFRYLKLNYFASFAGGYIFGFSSYEMGQLLAHINLIYIFPIPLMLILILKRFNGNIRKTSFIFLTAILMVFLLGVTTEIITTYVFFLFLSLAIFIIYFYKNKEVVNKIYKLAIDIIISGIVALLISSPFIYYLIKGLGNTHGLINTPKDNSADLLNFFIPSPVTKIGGMFFKNISANFFPNYYEIGAYISLPLLIVVFLSIKKKITEKWAKPLAFITVMLAVFSLGPYLHFDGFITEIPLPGHLLLFPPIDKALPMRFVMYVSLFAGFWTALWINDIYTNQRNYKPVRFFGSYVFLIIGLIMIMPNPKIYGWAKPIFNKKSIKYIVPKHKAILPIPYEPYGQGALWIAGSNFRIYMSGPSWGALIGRRLWPAQRMFHNNLLYPDYKTQINDYMANHHIRYVVMSNYDNQDLMWKNVFLKLRWKLIKGQGIDVFKMPDVLYKKYNYISHKEAVSNFLFNEFSNLYKASKLLQTNENKKNDISNKFLDDLYPKYLESHGYLSKGYGYVANKAKFKYFTANRGGGYIGKWDCGTKLKCFAVGVKGTYGEVKNIIKYYYNRAFRIYFPYPKKFINNGTIKGDSKGKILIVFKVLKLKEHKN